MDKVTKYHADMRIVTDYTFGVILMFLPMGSSRATTSCKPPAWRRRCSPSDRGDPVRLLPDGHADPAKRHGVHHGDVDGGTISVPPLFRVFMDDRLGPTAAPSQAEADKSDADQRQRRGFRSIAGGEPFTGKSRRRVSGEKHVDEVTGTGHEVGARAWG